MSCNKTEQIHEHPKTISYAHVASFKNISRLVYLIPPYIVYSTFVYFLHTYTQIFHTKKITHYPRTLFPEETRGKKLIRETNFDVWAYVCESIMLTYYTAYCGPGTIHNILYIILLQAVEYLASEMRCARQNQNAGPVGRFVRELSRHRRWNGIAHFGI